MATNEFYYLRGKRITRDEAHALPKREQKGLVVANRLVDFSKEFLGEVNGKESNVS